MNQIEELSKLLVEFYEKFSSWEQAGTVSVKVQHSFLATWVAGKARLRFFVLLKTLEGQAALG